MVGVTVRDTLSGKQHTVYARTIVNAAGPFSDEVRALSQVGGPPHCAARAMYRHSWYWPPQQRHLSCCHALHRCPTAPSMPCPAHARRIHNQGLSSLPFLQPGAKMIMPSSGVHVTLPDYYSPENGALGLKSSWA